MNKRLQLSYWGLIAILLISLFMVATTAVTLWQTNKLNEYIAAPDVHEIEQAPSHPYTQLALGYALEQQDMPQQALDVLTELLTTEDRMIRAAAYYNRGIISLKQAALMQDGHPKQIPLIELAKQDFRHALMIEPTLWDARFNLEVALNLVPELPIDDSLFEKNEISSSRSIESVGFRVDLP